LGSITVVEGSVGVGKTTFCEKLHDEYKANDYPSIVLKEYVNDTILAWFLEDEVGNAFEFQLIMLYQRIKTYRRALKLKKRGFAVIVDRSLPGDMAFELMHKKRGSISPEQHRIYLEVIKENSKYLDVPDHCILLSVEVKSARINIKNRGRPGELKVYTPEYLSNLNDSYEFCLQHFSVPVLRVDYDLDPRRKIEFGIEQKENDARSSKIEFDTQFMYAILDDLVASKMTNKVAP
jgi:deoxyadenosine/deoxycytidine kinase